MRDGPSVVLTCCNTSMPRQCGCVFAIDAAGGGGGVEMDDVKASSAQAQSARHVVHCPHIGDVNVYVQVF